MLLLTLLPCLVVMLRHNHHWHSHDLHGMLFRYATLRGILYRLYDAWVLHAHASVLRCLWISWIAHSFIPNFALCFSDIIIAIACFLLFTFFPLPVFNVPALNLLITNFQGIIVWFYLSKQGIYRVLNPIRLVN